MRDETAGQRAGRHQAPAQQAVGAVDPAEQAGGHDLLSEADRDDVPHGDGEALAGITAAMAGSGASPIPMKTAALITAPVINEGSMPSL